MATIVTRVGKGSKLTHIEMDANLTNLNDAVIDAKRNSETLTVTSDTPLDGTKRIILVDATSGPVTITLDTATNSKDKIFHIKKIDSSANVVTIDGNGAETIDGVASISLVKQWETSSVTSDGTESFTLLLKEDKAKSISISAHGLGKPTTDPMADSFLGVFPVVLADDTTEESAYISFRVPTDWKLGTNMDVHLHYVNVATQTGTNNVVLGMEYAAAANGEDFTPATTTVEITEALANNELADVVHEAAPMTIIAANLAVDDEVGIRLFRKAADASDTVIGDVAIGRIEIRYTERS